MTVVAALQIGTGASLVRGLAFEDEIRASGASLVVLPEAVLGGCPRGEPFVEYFGSSITVPGPEVTALAGLAARTGASLVAGVIERDGSTPFAYIAARSSGRWSPRGTASTSRGTTRGRTSSR
jgi:nitrilase